MEHEELKKLDLKDYKIPEKSNAKNLKKNQRLALQIIKEFKIDKKWHGWLFRIVKRYPAFIEDKFLSIKKLNLKNPAGYLWSIITRKNQP